MRTTQLGGNRTSRHCVRETAVKGSCLEVWESISSVHRPHATWRQAFQCPVTSLALVWTPAVANRARVGRHRPAERGFNDRQHWAGKRDNVRHRPWSRHPVVFPGAQDKQILICLTRGASNGSCVPPNRVPPHIWSDSVRKLGGLIHGPASVPSQNIQRCGTQWSCR